jgi:hypothetical protein
MSGPNTRLPEEKELMVINIKHAQTIRVVTTASSDPRSAAPVSPDPESAGSVSPDPLGAGSVSPDLLGAGQATFDPPRKGSTLSDPRDVGSIPPDPLERNPPRPTRGLRSQARAGARARASFFCGASYRGALHPPALQRARQLACHKIKSKQRSEEISDSPWCHWTMTL